MGNDVIHKVCRRLRHTPGATRRAEPAAFAAEGDQLVVTAVGATQPKETVRQDAALQEGIELVLDEGRQARTRGGRDLSEEGLGMLLHQAV